MPENILKMAGTLSARASKSLDAMRTHVTPADAARSAAAHQARAAKLVAAANHGAAEGVGRAGHPRGKTSAQLPTRG